MTGKVVVEGYRYFTSSGSGLKDRRDWNCCRARQYSVVTNRQNARQKYSRRSIEKIHTDLFLVYSMRLVLILILHLFHSTSLTSSSAPSTANHNPFQPADEAKSSPDEQTKRGAQGSKRPTAQDKQNGDGRDGCDCQMKPCLMFQALSQLQRPPIN
ncbi:hypothetical protein BKA65DRAFT_158419 [Rhexocercosporidium sp. MPI-PUGE-AT-0058]|nr:hypothetical protein BKA65DRAFT_158419 [Rhexocercosporidium sp. MPI-PUGE-AT-0058]